ncbi:MAG: SDR family oxidoreductase [Deltaproteobacteria bacterium]
MPSNQIRTYSGAIALVTGAASGIGAALSRELARRGATVILADRQLEMAQGIARELGDSARAVALDVRDADAFAAVVTEVREREGRIDYLFNNAGIGMGGPVEDHSIEDWRYLIDVNLMGVVHGVHSVYPILLEQGFGHIVNTASMAGQIPCPGLTAYAATKHAVVGLTRSLRAECAATGVRVSAFCPGVIRTEILKDGGIFGKAMGWASSGLDPADIERARPMNADEFAKAALDGVAANQEIIILPRFWRLAYRLDRIFPGFAARRLAKRFEKDTRHRKSRTAGAGG